MRIITNNTNDTIQIEVLGVTLPLVKYGQLRINHYQYLDVKQQLDALKSAGLINVSEHIYDGTVQAPDDVIAIIESEGAGPSVALEATRTCSVARSEAEGFIDWGSEYIVDGISEAKSIALIEGSHDSVARSIAELAESLARAGGAGEDSIARSMASANSEFSSEFYHDVSIGFGYLAENTSEGISNNSAAIVQGDSEARSYAYDLNYSLGTFAFQQYSSAELSIADNHSEGNVNKSIALNAESLARLGSSVPASYLRRTLSIKLVEDGDALTTGKLKTYVVPEDFDGWYIWNVELHIFTASSSGLPTIQIYNRGVGDPFDDNLFSTLLTIDVGEYDSKDADTPAVIRTGTYNTLVEATNLEFWCNVAGTGTLGAELRITFSPVQIGA